MPPVNITEPQPVPLLPLTYLNLLVLTQDEEEQHMPQSKPVPTTLAPASNLQYAPVHASVPSD